MQFKMANADALPPADVGALPPAGATPVLKRRMSELLALPMPVDVGVSVTVSQLRDVCVVEQRFYVDYCTRVDEMAATSFRSHTACASDSAASNAALTVGYAWPFKPAFAACCAKVALGSARGIWAAQK